MAQISILLQEILDKGVLEDYHSWCFVSSLHGSLTRQAGATPDYRSLHLGQVHPLLQIQDVYPGSGLGGPDAGFGVDHVNAWFTCLDFVNAYW